VDDEKASLASASDMILELPSAATEWRIRWRKEEDETKEEENDSCKS